MGYKLLDRIGGDQPTGHPTIKDISHPTIQETSHPTIQETSHSTIQETSHPTILDVESSDKAQQIIEPSSISGQPDYQVEINSSAADAADNAVPPPPPVRPIYPTSADDPSAAGGQETPPELLVPSLAPSLAPTSTYVNPSTVTYKTVVTSTSSPQVYDQRSPVSTIIFSLKEEGDQSAFTTNQPSTKQYR